MVEVIIVVAIIAILASIIMPKMTGTRDKSKLESCKQNLRNLGTALELYANDNNGKYGTASAWTDAGCYLVTSGYIKPLQCPIGKEYRVWINYTGTWCGAYGVTSGGPLITCECYQVNGGVSHRGCGVEFPAYWPAAGVVTR